MIDPEKTITGLEKLRKDLGYGLPDRSNVVMEYLNSLTDAIELLMEQKAVEPILKRESYNKYYNYYVCPCCGDEVVYEQNYCSECGVKFTWEGQ